MSSLRSFFVPLLILYVKSQERRLKNHTDVLIFSIDSLSQSRKLSLIAVNCSDKEVTYV